MISCNPVYVVSAARTPIGCFLGQLSTVNAVTLGAEAVKGAVSKANIDPSLVDEVIFGNVLTAGSGQNPARQVAINAGLKSTTIATTVNKVCASGMKAVSLGAQSIMTGQCSIVVVGGTESMSNVPYYQTKVRSGNKYGNFEVLDGVLRDGLTDAHTNAHMGMAGELCAEKYSISRESLDEYAINSYLKAQSATKEGRFEEEIVPITIKGSRGKPDIKITSDEEVKNLNIEKLKSLRPAFKSDGVITAGNAPPLSDGAAALVLASHEQVVKLNLKPIAIIRGFADAEQEGDWFTTTPSLAIPKAVERAGIDLKEIDYFELNEAFSVVALSNIQILNLDMNKVNVNGGAVAMGHPIGCSGARILVTLIQVLKQNSAKFGAAGICNGGGGASAMVIENYIKS